MTMTTILWMNMKWTQRLIALDMVLWAIYFCFLIIGWINKEMGPLPLCSELASWKYFGWVVLGYIPVMVGLGAVLLFLKAISTPYEVRTR